MRADEETKGVHRVGIGVVLQAVWREGLVDSTASSFWRWMAGCLIFVHEFFWGDVLVGEYGWLGWCWGSFCSVVQISFRNQILEEK